MFLGYIYSACLPLFQDLSMTKASLKPLEETSVIRKFSLLFLLVSVLPLTLLYFFYYQLTTNKPILGLKPALLLTALGIGVGFWAMRKILLEFIRIIKINRFALTQILGEEVVTDNDENNEIVLLARVFNEVCLHLRKDADHQKKIKQTLSTILTKVGKEVSSPQSLKSFLNLTLETVTDALLANEGFIFLVNERSSELYAECSCGIKGERLKDLRFKIDAPFLGAALHNKRGLIFSESNNFHADLPAILPSLFEYPLMCCPLQSDYGPLGLLMVCGRTASLNFQQDDLLFLSNVSLQVSAALSNKNFK
jgi:hypothetical protein